MANQRIVDSAIRRAHQAFRTEQVPYDELADLFGITRTQIVARAAQLGYQPCSASAAPSKHRRGLPSGGRRPDLDNQYFRSAWEANIARYLNWLTAQGEVAAWEYEPETFRFDKITRGTVSYTPDFRVTYPDGRHEWWEVKGFRHQRGETAMRRFARYYPTEAERLVLVDADAYRGIASTFQPLCPTWETPSRNTERT